MDLKINLGGGFKNPEGFINIDDDPLVKPDHLVDLDDVNVKLPFEDNSVIEIRAHHILEHIGDAFIPLIKEMYRVAKHGCILDIIAPNERHDVFYGDPTHKRPINANVMHLFSKKYCNESREKFTSNSGMALKYNIDWEMLEYHFEYDQFYIPMLNNFFQRKEAGKITEEEEFAVQRLMREANNVAIHNIIKMVAIKK